MKRKDSVTFVIGEEEEERRFLYLLLDSETRVPFWVGQSRSILSRYQAHVRMSDRLHQPRPFMQVIAVLSTEAEAQRIEDLLITRLRLKGVELRNKYPSPKRTKALIDTYGLRVLRAAPSLDAVEQFEEKFAPPAH